MKVWVIVEQPGSYDDEYTAEPPKVRGVFTTSSAATVALSAMVSYGLTLHEVPVDDGDAFVERVAEATMDWWDFDGSYREANDFDDKYDIKAIMEDVQQ